MQKPQALAISLGLHVATFFALMYAPPISLPRLPEKSPSEYEQAFKGKEDKIVWYKFRELPDIAPPDSPKVRKPPQAEVEAKQAIVSSPKNAPKRNQVVVTEAPPMDLPPLDLPNLIAVKLPPKQFTTPPDLVRPDAPKIEMPEVPETQTQQLEVAKLPADRLPAKAFVPPSPVKPVQTAVKIEPPSEAPKFEGQSTPTKLPAVRLPARAYVPPASQAPVEARRIGAATRFRRSRSAPRLGTRSLGSNFRLGLTLLPSVPAPPGKPGVAVPLIEGPAGDVTIAIAGLNPATTPVQLPAASSPAQFSAGQKVRPDGATSEGAGKGITAPDLYARSSSESSKPELLALTFAAPTSKAFIDDSLRHTTLTPGPAPGGATRVSNAPDPRFNGREVYMMAIQMANLTSSSGSWLMWYSPRTMDATALAGMTAPVPYRKVDPKYTQVAQADRLQGRVQFSCVIGRDGKVSSIELLHGADERLNKSAGEALSKWEFYPATRNGQAVDVDVVVEIPFVLAPPSPSR